ncbi:MAG: hypothetical protein OEY88_00310 [Candidatus Bathyarchaeota archaeon]|nr:hypothetical protein [Candidatus Bathyarchaeota archaeon]
MNEHSLHSAIKEWYSLPEDRFEARIDGFIIDILRGSLLIEVQTKSFRAIKRKLSSLVENHEVRLVYPIPERKWIVRTTESSELISKRKSPRKRKLVDLFYELVSIPNLIARENFSLDVLMIEEEEIRCNDGKGSWRRRGVSIKDRKLIDVRDRVFLKDEVDFRRFLPNDLERPFTNRSLADLTGIPLYLTRKMTYCLRKMGAIRMVGKNRRELIFTDLT